MYSQTTHNTVRFTVAQMEDAHQLQPMVAGLYQEDANPESPKLTAPQINRTLAELHSKPDKGKVVAMWSNNELAGYAIIIYFWSNEYGGNVIEIDELYVAPNHRSKGLGKSFFEWLFTEYENSSGFALQVSRTNDRARKLYEAVGFTKSSSSYMLKIK
ncbi:MAG TPA: GNAT family N-acetyltransferase [Drouetiella sp.]|jgi:GNAT superfamily N-acetyltransferase